MKTQLTFLGTGTSQGIPVIGCECEVCKSRDPKDNRFRSSALVKYGDITILVDCGPDFRIQMLREDVQHLDAVLLTHSHKDHTGGMDDLRSFNLLEHKPINIYCEEYVENSLKKEYSYAFTEHHYPGVPEWGIKRIDGHTPFMVEPNDTGSFTIDFVNDGYVLHRLSATIDSDANIAINNDNNHHYYLSMCIKMS